MRNNKSSWKKFEPHPLINFEIEKYYQNKPTFNSVCSEINGGNKGRAI